MVSPAAGVGAWAARRRSPAARSARRLPPAPALGCRAAGAAAGSSAESRLDEQRRGLDGRRQQLVAPRVKGAALRLGPAADLRDLWAAARARRPGPRSGSASGSGAGSDRSSLTTGGPARPCPPRSTASSRRRSSSRELAAASATGAVGCAPPSRAARRAARRSRRSPARPALAQLRLVVEHQGQRQRARARAPRRPGWRPAPHSVSAQTSPSDAARRGAPDARRAAPPGAAPRRPRR